MTSFMVSQPKQGTGGGLFSTLPATPAFAAPVKTKVKTKKVKKAKVKKVVASTKAVSLLTTRPKNKSKALAVARTQANNYAIDLDKLTKAVESGKVEIDPRSLSHPQNTSDQRAVLLHQASKLARLSKRLEVGIFNDKNNKLIYSLLNVYQQQAEVVDQIVKLADLGGRAEKVVDKIIDPFAREVASSLAGLLHSLGEALHGMLKDEEIAKAQGVLVTHIRKVGGELQKSRNDMVARVPHVLMDE